MWVFTNQGFFSAVHKDGAINLRFRSREHVEVIRDLYPDPLKGKKIREYGQADYRWRFLITQAEFVSLMTQIAAAVDYGNFKDSVRDDAYHDVLLQVWRVMYSYQGRMVAAIRRTAKGVSHFVNRSFQFGDGDDWRL